ncbi:MAG: DUF4258 domain-containing protein [Gammaproteobacteria bacterium]|nr:DUF4258 domain-containing protein [Gammaproteobacteria bacterium]
MKISYSPHAVDRMASRKISTADVEALLSNPDGRIQQSKDKVIVYKRVEGRSDNMLAVVAVERQFDTEIITVMVNFEVT